MSEADEDDVFYVEVTGYKHGPLLYGPYLKREWDLPRVLDEFHKACSPGFRTALITSDTGRKDTF